MADDKVVPIGLHAVHDSADPDVVERLAGILEQAKAGKVTSFTIVTQGEDRVSVLTSVPHDLPTLLGHLDIMHADVLAKAVTIFKPGPRG